MPQKGPGQARQLGPPGPAIAGSAGRRVVSLVMAEPWGGEAASKC